MVEKTSTYYQVGALIAVILASGLGYYMMPVDSYDICVSSGEYGEWSETETHFQYYCEPEDKYQFCWDVSDYGNHTNAKCMRYEILGNFTVYNESNAVGVVDDNLNILFAPETIECYPYGANDNIVSRCPFEITIEDYLDDSACLELPLIRFEDDNSKENLTLYLDYGTTQDTHDVCIESHYDESMNTTICDEYETIIDHSYISGDKICNINHSRTLTGYFEVPYLSTGKFNTYFPFMGMAYVIDPYWISNSSNFANGDYSNTFLNGSFVQLNSSSLSGSYTSEILPTGSTETMWYNISWGWNFNEDYVGVDLPDNEASESGDYGIDMSNNVLLLHLDENSGTTVSDSSGNGNNGAFVGGPQWINGKFNSGIDIMNATNPEYLSINHDSSLNPGTGNWTVEAWLKSQSEDVFHNIITKDNAFGSGTRMLYAIYARTNGAVAFNLYNADKGQLCTATSTTVIADGNWHHVVGVRDRENGVCKIYVDGVLEDTDSEVVTGGVSDLQNTVPLTIGSPYNAPNTVYQYNGSVDEVAIYSKALSADEVLNRYKRGAIDLNISVRSCDDSECSGESWGSEIENNPENLTVDDNRYFQWKADFEISNINQVLVPKLYNVTVGYDENISMYLSEYLSESSVAPETEVYVYGHLNLSNETSVANNDIYIYLDDSLLAGGEERGANEILNYVACSDTLHSAGHNCTQAVDDNTDTYWQNYVDVATQEIAGNATFNLSSRNSIYGFEIIWYGVATWAQYAESYTIYGSNDYSNWVHVHNVTGNSAITNTENFSSTATYQYWKLALDDTGAVKEFRLFQAGTQTDSNGDYNYTFNAPASAGSYNITVNSTYGDYYAENLTVLTVEEAADTCTWGESSDWIINISDNCILNTITDLTNAYKLIVIGDDGKLTINTTISAGEVHYTPDDFDGGYTIETTTNGRVEVIK